MDAESKRQKAKEASRRWRAANPERAKAVGRAAYHRTQQKLGLESAERLKFTDDEIRERKKANQRARNKTWRERHPEAVKAATKKRYEVNGERQRQRSLEWYRANKEHAKARVLRGYKATKYGLSQEQYDALVKLCGICGATKTNGKKTRLHVDHCHDTKKVRGMLCGGCNVGLGQFRHDIALLQKAIDYLTLHQVPVDVIANPR